MQQTHTLAPGIAATCASPHDYNLQGGSQKMASSSDDLMRSGERRIQGERMRELEHKVRGESEEEGIWSQ